MSGGRFDYRDNLLATDIFGYGVAVDYDLGNEENEESRVMVRKQNYFEDKEISELIYDVFCLMHSYDYYRSGDTDEETYRKDINYFKDKWFKTEKPDRIKILIDNELNQMKEDMYKTFNIEP